MRLASKYAREGLVFVTILAAAAWLGAWPQTNPGPGNRLAFDVVSINLHQGGPSAGLDLRRSGGHVSLTASLRELMILAFNLNSLSQAADTIIGMPSWASDTFDIEAEAPGDPTVDQKRLMLQSLLANRFQMVAHHETRQSPIYALVLAKAGKLGPQLHPHAADTACHASRAAQPSSANEHSAEAVALEDLERFPCGRVAGGFLSPGDHIA
jgi:uncharacterized protein (TIGR03435 family)